MTLHEPIIIPASTHEAPVSAPVRFKLKTLEDYAREFLAGFSNHHTRRNYAADLRHFLEATAGNLEDTSLLVYKELLVSESAARTAKRRLSVVESFLSHLVLKDVLARNLYAHISRLAPRIDKYDSPTVALEDSEVRRMISRPDRSTLLGASQRIAMALGFYLGLRRSEMVSIKIQDISADRVLRIKGKGSKVRMIPLDEVVVEEITSYLDVTSALLGRARSSSEYLLVGQKAKDGASKLHTDTINEWFKSVAEACGIDKHITTHTGRATVITKLLEEEAPIRDVAVFAGHSSVDTTSIYDKKNRTARLSVVRKIRY